MLSIALFGRNAVDVLMINKEIIALDVEIKIVIIGSFHIEFNNSLIILGKTRRCTGNNNFSGVGFFF